MEKLSSSEIFSGTSIFSWIKMGLSAAIAAVSIIVFAIVNAVCSRGDGSFNIIGLVIWLALTCVIAIGVKTAVACKFRAAHVAVVVDAVNMGVIPEGQVSAGVETVTSRFGSVSGYAAVEKGVRGSVMKIQKTLNVYGGRMLGVPVVSQLIKLSQNFVGWALGFMSDCCMGYTFNDEEQGVYRSATDAVTAYHQTWRNLYQNALKLALIMMSCLVIAFLLVFFILVPVFSSAAGSAVYGLVVAAVITFILVKGFKNAVVDSYFMINTMERYFDEARYAMLDDEYYAPLYKLSKKYQSLYSRGKQDEARAAAAENN